MDVPGGDACHDVRVELGATATLTVRTEPPAARALVEILRLPAERSQAPAWAPAWERNQHNPTAHHNVLLVGASRANELGQASVRGGNPGDAVVVRAQGSGLAGQTDTTLALSGEVVVPMAATAGLEVSLAEKPSANFQLGLKRVTADGGLDPLGLGFALQFGGAPDAELTKRLTQPSQTPDSNKRGLWTRALRARDAEAIKQLLEETTLDRGGQPPTALAEFDLRAGEHKDLALDLAQPGKLELKVTLPPEPHTWGLVDEDTGAFCAAADARAGRARVIVFAFDGRRWLSRDVLTIPTHGVVTWTPDLVPMRITLRLRSPNGRPIGNTGVSRVGANETTDGWHGQSLGLTDAAGEIELSGNVHPFKLRVDGITALVGPYTPDPRREVQVIEVEVPTR